MGVPELGFGVATVLAVIAVLPQCVRLGRTRDHEGVSLTGATLGVATEIAWLAFMVEGHLWTAVTMPALMMLANTALAYWIVRAGSEIGSTIGIVAAWIAVLAAVGLFGGWTALGLVLGFSYAVQIAPTISAAYRSALPTGIAPARWVLVTCEACLWMFFGAARGEPSIVIVGMVAAASAAAILLRWVTTRRRVTETALALDSAPSLSMASSRVHDERSRSSRLDRSLPASSSVSRFRNAS